MKNTRFYIFFAMVLMLAGCASVLNPFTTDVTFAGISPPQIHRKDDEGRIKAKMGLNPAIIQTAEAKPFIEYYAALDQAASASGTREQVQVQIDDYIAKGITVVNISCLRWFNSLSESQARFA